MIHRLLFALALGLLLTAAPARAQSPTPAPAESPAPSPSPNFEPALVVSDNGRYVNLREGPSLETRSIAQLAPGERVVCAFAEGETWLPVRANGVTGYMMAEYLTPAPPETDEAPVNLCIQRYEGTGYTLSATLTEEHDILTAHAEVTYASETGARLTGVTLLLDGREAAKLLPYSASEDPSEAAFHVAFYDGNEVSDAALRLSDGTEIPFEPLSE